MLVGLPEPEDLPREEAVLSVLSLKEELRRLRDKFGQPGAAILSEVETLVSKYEDSWNDEAKSSSGVNGALAVRVCTGHRIRYSFVQLLPLFAF